jgi:antitoxin HigA-1
MADSETGLGFPPPHPGQVLKDDVLTDLGLTVTAFARHLGVPRAGLSALLNGRKPVTQDMAIRLGQALRTGARFWLALQLQYDVWHKLPQQAETIWVAPLTPDGQAAA